MARPLDKCCYRTCLSFFQLSNFYITENDIHILVLSNGNHSVAAQCQNSPSVTFALHTVNMTAETNEVQVPRTKKQIFQCNFVNYTCSDRTLKPFDLGLVMAAWGKYFLLLCPLEQPLTLVSVSNMDSLNKPHTLMSFVWSCLLFLFFFFYSAILT